MASPAPLHADTSAAAVAAVPTPSSTSSIAKCSQCSWQLSDADGLCLECQQWRVDTDVGGISGRSLVARRDLSAGACVLTESNSMWQCAIDPATPDLRRLDRAPDLWAAHQQLLAQLALVYDLPEARAEIDALCTFDTASYLSHRGHSGLHGERHAYLAMTRDFATTYADQFPGVSAEQMEQLMIRIRINGKIVRKYTKQQQPPQAAPEGAATSAAASTAAAASPPPPLVTAVALCLPRLLSAANHSCIPNCILLSGARRLVALRPIAANAPLTISYLPLDQLREWDTAARRARLWEDYLFVCTCERCTADEDATASGQGESKLAQEWRDVLASMDAAVALDEAAQAAAVSAGVRSTVVSRCSVCAKATDQRCGQCKSVHFCSRDCQKLAWRDHKAECKAAPKPSAS